jgi:3-hydroxyisobutyrate dehydrogenase-like beta-hydroxyacid dehydrogenase
MSEIRVGFIGAGQMGRPMVERLCAAGFATEVFARRVELQRELEAAGIATGTSAAEVGAGADVLILCLFSDSQVREVLLDAGGLAAMRPGSVIISHVTGSPQLAVELQAVAPSGVTILDVPVSGTADHICRGELTMLVGGEAEALEKIQPVLAAYGNPVLHVGGLGDGQRMKLVNNLLFTVHLRVGLEAAALAESLGISSSEFARVISACSGDSFAVRLFSHVNPTALAAGAKHFLAKDVNAIRDVADAQSLDLGLLGDLANWVFE